MPCIPLPLETIPYSERQKFISSIIKYHKNKKSPRPIYLKHVPTYILEKTRRFRGLDTLVGVYQSPDAPAHFQNIYAYDGAAPVTLNSGDIKRFVIMVFLDSIEGFDISTQVQEDAQLVYVCVNAPTLHPDNRTTLNSLTFQSLLPVIPGERAVFSRLWKLLPRDHPLWASFTRGDPRRWSFSDFRAIVLNGSSLHPWATVYATILTSNASMSELYEIWLRAGYEALVDFVLSSSQYYEPCLDYAESWDRYLLMENTTARTRESAIVQGVAQCIPEIGAALKPALRSIVRMIMVAVDNPRYIKGVPDNCEKQGNKLGHLDKPCAIITEDGVIVAWYLPGLIEHGLLEMLTSATMDVKHICAGQVDARSDASWRRRAESHIHPDNGSIDPGTANFSPGYYDLSGRLCVSAAFQNSSCKSWMDNMSDVQTALDALLLLTHPSQYLAAVAVVEAIRANRDLNVRTPHQSHWPSRTWQGITVLINRITDPHRDSHGPPAAFDLLLASGSARSAKLRLPYLEASLAYYPGTVVLILAKLITHEVPQWESGDRVCYAQWLRNRSVVKSPVKHVQWCSLPDVQAQWNLLERLGDI